jgi:hypothetical protein
MPSKVNKEAQAPQGAEEEITVDMATAKVLAPLDPTKAYLMSVSKWTYGKTVNGPKLDYAWTVISPEVDEGRVVAGSSSLGNKYSLGFVKQMLTGLKFKGLDDPKFKMPKSADVEGLQATVFTRIQAAQGAYGPRSIISRLITAEEYAETPAEE